MGLTFKLKKCLPSEHVNNVKPKYSLVYVYTRWTDEITINNNTTNKLFLN